MKKPLFFLVGSLAISTLFSCVNYPNFKLTIVFTNDTHGAINKALSFANAGAIKQAEIDKGNNVLLLDAGDIISGGFYTTYDQGYSMVKFMEEAGYDASTLGNHEFDYKFDYLDEIVKNSKFPFISTNLYHMKDNVPTTRYTDLGSKVFSFPQFNVGVIGVSTPESITSSTPKYFQDDKGNYIYTFLDKDNQIYKTVQEEIDILKNNKNCRYVICLSHLGDQDQSSKFTATKLANNTSGIDVILDGHTHIPDIGKTVKDKNNKDVFITQAGGTFSNIGKLTLERNTPIKNELISNTDLVNTSLKEKENKLVKELDESLSKEIATSDIDFSNKSKDTKEYNLGDLCAEASYYYYNIYLPEVKKEEGVEPASISFVNTGGIRTSVAAGTWKKKTCQELHPFGNGVCEIKIKGSILRNALEFSSYKIPDYFGGLQQVCGVTYDVDTSIESDIVVDSNNNYVSGPSESHRRLSNIKIYKPDKLDYEDLNDDEEYVICGSSYVLLNGGDGMSMFVKEGTKIREEGNLVDKDILEIYISNFTKDSVTNLPKISSSTSPISSSDKYNKITINYDTEPFGGRINIIK